MNKTYDDFLAEYHQMEHRVEELVEQVAELESQLEAEKEATVGCDECRVSEIALNAELEAQVAALKDELLTLATRVLTDDWNKLEWSKWAQAKAKEVE